MLLAACASCGPCRLTEHAHPAASALALADLGIECAWLTTRANAGASLRIEACRASCALRSVGHVGDASSQAARALALANGSGKGTWAAKLASTKLGIVEGACGTALACVAWEV